MLTVNYWCGRKRGETKQFLSFAIQIRESPSGGENEVED